MMRLNSSPLYRADPQAHDHCCHAIHYGAGATASARRGTTGIGREDCDPSRFWYSGHASGVSLAVAGTIGLGRHARRG